MSNSSLPRCSAFVYQRLIASGSSAEVATVIKSRIDQGEYGFMMFDNEQGDFVDLDYRLPLDIILRMLAARERKSDDTVTPEASADASRGRGRPKLGVVAREVTLLPRQWDWLATQPGGASVTLRKLVDQARRDNRGLDQIRRAQEHVYTFLSGMAGDLPQFEEVTRALFAKDAERFANLMADWPQDLKTHALDLAKPAFLEGLERE